MRRRHRGGNGWTQVLMLAVAAGAISLSPLPGQIARYVKGKDLRWPDFYETPGAGRSHTNRLRGMLMGAEGQSLSNDLFVVRLTQMRLEHYDLLGKTNLVALAPECLFDTQNRVAWSTTSRLDIVGMNGALLVHGDQGFHLVMTNSTMTVSNRVRTTLRQDMLKLARP